MPTTHNTIIVGAGQTGLATSYHLKQRGVGSVRTQCRGRITSFLICREDLFMSCPHCLSTSISKRKYRTSLGYRTFYSQDCDKRFNERSGTQFNDLQFPNDIVLLSVFWHLRYKLGFRDVAELLLQRGFEVSHETIRLWEFRFAPLVSENLRAKRRGTELVIPGIWTRPTSKSVAAGDISIEP